MARKDVLKGLMGDPPPRPAPEDAAPRAARGAIGAVSRSIADLRSRAVIEIDPALIEAGGFSDRLEGDDESDRSLRESIAAHGQQVPVLVRPHPDRDGRFQIVYGRRRVLALRDLGQAVKALVRDLDDRELVLAQGQENSARRDLSFIEKVNFARQMAAAGYDRKVIGDALVIDKTLVSRMLSVAERVPDAVVGMIGAAPSVGRDRWLLLADLIDETSTSQDELAAMIGLLATSPRSDDRFAAAWSYLRGLKDRNRPALRRPAPQAVRAADGRTLAQVRHSPTFCTLRMRVNQTCGFEDWLVQTLPDLYANWQQRQTAPNDPDP